MKRCARPTGLTLTIGDAVGLQRRAFTQKRHIQGAGWDSSVEIKDLKRVVRRVGATGNRRIRGAIMAGLTRLGAEPISVTGVVYPDGQTINVLLRKKKNDKPVALEIVGASDLQSRDQLELVAEAPGWIQFFGRIPEGTDAFELRVRRESRTVPLVDATSGNAGHGHVAGARSWKGGAHWQSKFGNRSLRFTLVDDTEATSVVGVRPGLGRLELRLGRSANAPAETPQLSLRARKSAREIVLRTESVGEQLLCVIDGVDTGRALGATFAGKTVWDVVADGNRLRAGQSDVTDPRSAYKFGWVRAKSSEEFVKIRPYWTLNGYLSLEIILTTSATMPNNP